AFSYQFSVNNLPRRAIDLGGLKTRLLPGPQSSLQDLQHLIILIFEDRAGIQHDPVILQPGDEGWVCLPQAIEEAVGVGYGQGQQIRWQGFSRQASSAHRRFTRDYLTLIDAPTPGFRTPADLLRGSGQHLPDRNFSFRLILQVMQ